MVARASLIVSSIALLTSFVNAYGQVAQIVDANNFCVFLPPTDSTDRLISDTEWNAQAFCLGDAPKATNAGKLKTGFIQSAHYVKTDAYVQITGQIDPTKENLDPTDEGGQYDVKAPTGATCAGWQYFVNLIEPFGNTYCIRCCNDTTNCNRGISSKGCAHIIPGDYSGPFTGDTSASAAASTAASSASTKKVTSTKEASSTKKTSSTKKASSTKTTAAKATSTDSSKPTTTAAAAAGTADGDSSSTADATTDAAPTADSAASADDSTSSSSTDDSTSSASTDGDASSSSASASRNAAAEIASPPSSPDATSTVSAAASSADAAASSAASSSSDAKGVVSEQSINQSESGAESLRPVILTLAITAVSMALIQ